MIVYISLLVAVIGIFMYVLCANVKLVEIGRLAYFAGLFAFLLQLTPKMVDLFK
jgi:hypothetical protein